MQSLDANRVAGDAPGPRPARDPGEGSSTIAATFRDPPLPTEEADALKVAIARALVRAPRLPVALPGNRLSLLDVKVDRHGIDLLFGPSAPVASMRLVAKEAAEPVSLSAPRAVAVSVGLLRPEGARFGDELGVMAERVAASVSRERWEDAWASARKLLRLPVGIPIGFFRQMVAGIEEPQGLVRTGFNCNQDCGMCWQGRDWGRFGSEQVLIWIEDLARAGARRLIISGGEPTLDPELERYLRRARELGFQELTLETNAIQFAKAAVAARMRDAGLGGCFVSLHSGDAEVSDAITRAPGTFVRTIKGIQALLEAGVDVSLNCVLTNEGLDHVGGLPDFIHDSFGAHPKLQGLMLSLPTDSFDRDLIRGIIPDPVKLRRVLRPTVDRAFALGINVRGLDGPCGPPLCAFGADPRITRLKPVPEALDFRIYLPACERCAVRPACFGVRDVQVAVYGDACVEPILTAPTPQA